MQSEQIAELIKALIKASSEFRPIEKDKENTFLKKGNPNGGKYATLDSVLKSVEPALLKHGLKVVQTVDIHESGSPVLVTTLYHESGQFLSSNYPLIVLDDPQKTGIAVTYARRYALCALLSVTADSDTDGEGAKPERVEKPAIVTLSPNKQEKIDKTTEELKRIGWSNAAAKLYLEQTYGKSTRKELTDAELQDFLSYLQSQKADS